MQYDLSVEQEGKGGCHPPRSGPSLNRKERYNKRYVVARGILPMLFFYASFRYSICCCSFLISSSISQFLTLFSKPYFLFLQVFFQVLFLFSFFLITIFHNYFFKLFFHSLSLFFLLLFCSKLLSPSLFRPFLSLFPQFTFFVFSLFFFIRLFSHPSPSSLIFLVSFPVLSPFIIF